MARHSDLSGRKFNRLNVSEYFSGSRKSRGKWRARIHKDKKAYHLGCFHTYEEALKIRKEFEIKLYEKEL